MRQFGLVLSIMAIIVGSAMLMGQVAGSFGGGGPWGMGRMMGYDGMPYMMWDNGYRPPADAPAPGSMVGGQYVVVLQNTRFDPADIRVKAGTTVRFINQDPFAHNVTNLTTEQVGKAKPGFQSPTLESGESWTHTFSEPGTYPILCTVGGHYIAGMVGTVTVTE